MIPIKLEFTETKIKIIEERLDEKTGDSTLKVQVKWQQRDTINNNGRSYPGAILQREIDRLQEGVAAGRVTGNAYHPEGDAKTIDVSHKWDKIWMTENGECLGNATIIPTENGKDLMIMIKNGVHPALSSRGYGTVTRKSKNIDGKIIPYDEVNEDYKLVSPGDFVLSPSVPDARIRAILESTGEKNMDNTKQKSLSEADKVMAGFEYAKKAGSPLSLADYKKAIQIDPKDKVAFRYARDEYGFQGSFEDFVKAKSKK